MSASSFLVIKNESFYLTLYNREVEREKAQQEQAGGGPSQLSTPATKVQSQIVSRKKYLNICNSIFQLININ